MCDDVDRLLRDAERWKDSGLMFPACAPAVLALAARLAEVEQTIREHRYHAGEQGATIVGLRSRLADWHRMADERSAEIVRLSAQLAEAERSIDTLLGMIRHQRDVLRECLPYLNESMAGRRPGRSADDIRASVKALTADSGDAAK